MSTIGLHVFCSVKGGVGKSTLAIASGKLLAERGSVPVIFDIDMLGASLADGLRLRAPVVETTTDGWLDLEAPPTENWYPVDASRKLRRARALQSSRSINDAARVPAPAFLNDAFEYPVPDPARECSIGAMLWRHEKPDGVWYLPSSPLRTDAARAAVWTVGSAGDFRWVRRLTWLIDGLLAQRPDVTDIVLDLPPGTWGFAHEVMVLVGTLARDQPLPKGYPRWATSREWRVNPFIVTSRDRNDRVSAMEYVLDTLTLIPNLVPLCNRAHEDAQGLMHQVRADLPHEIQDLKLETKLRFVPELRKSLGRTFVDGDLLLEEQEELFTALRLGEGLGSEARK